MAIAAFASSKGNFPTKTTRVSVTRPPPDDTVMNLRGAPRDVDAVVAATNAILSSRDAPFRAAYNALRGVHLLAVRAISAGETIATETPLLLTPKVHSRPFICAYCFLDARETGPVPRIGMPKRLTRRCPGCRTLRFCSEKCEAALGSRHAGVECAMLAAIAREEFDAQEQLVTAASLLSQLVRLLADRHNGASVEACAGMRVSYEDLTSRLTMLTDRNPEAEALVNEVVAVAQRVVPPEVVVPPAELSACLSKIDVNQFATYSRKRDHGLSVTMKASDGSLAASIGSAAAAPATTSGVRSAALACFVGVFPLFNHSCAPNVAFDSVPRVDSGEGSGEGGGEGCGEGGGGGDGGGGGGGGGGLPAFSVVSLVDINPGEELCIAYIATYHTRAKRREELRAHYGFDCSCARCLREGEDEEQEVGDWLAELRCTRPDCGSGYAVGEARRCLHCGRPGKGGLP